ncbi:hypothetical protein [Flavobacterium piscis]|uniref:Uncharacterized protein n=1 Tax=Flavobacterium piscis TaxID=1114874 RepID=A0ABU1Y9W9_9FLAO|nr:hypothetical protein [Flavobacterium piscis]MDR7210999.1 hypothetical protein [Flavobacterium piscis]
MEKIYDFKTIDELTSFLKLFEKSEISKFLENEFKNLTEYKTAKEWNKLVRICEALSIIGWENLERVDAICCKNGSNWNTELRNNKKELRFLSASWTKRKNGFVYSNPSYHFNPDVPEKQDIAWQDYPKTEFEEVNVPELSDQRNKQKVNPITFGGTYPLHSKIERDILFPQLLDLRNRFDHTLHTDLYGEGIDKISIRYLTAVSNDKTATSFLKGTYYPKTKEYKAEAFFGEEYAAASETERKKIIEKLLLQTLDDVKEKVGKHKLCYNVDLLITEVKEEITKWQA